MSLKAISTDQAPAAIGPYSQAIIAGDFMYISGQIPLDPATGELVERTIEVQATRVFENLQAILNEAGKDFSNVVKAEVYLDNMNDFKAVNTIYAQYFTTDPKPARQAVEVAKLPLEVLIEVSLIVFMG
ncbi:MAG: RidA family protein [Lentisphaeraceae bacterium]|nr:RidA family protein [Lentisphaeraceae bacterium]